MIRADWVVTITHPPADYGTYGPYTGKVARDLAAAYPYPQSAGAHRLKHGSRLVSLIERLLTRRTA